MPLAAHGLAPRRISLNIEQSPRPPPCRTRAFTGIVIGKAPVEIVRPSDIGPVDGLAGTAENIDEAFDRAVVGYADRGLIAFDHGLGIASVSHALRSAEVDASRPLS
jgi:hypothetical protein